MISLGSRFRGMSGFVDNKTAVRKRRSGRLVLTTAGRGCRGERIGGRVRLASPMLGFELVRWGGREVFHQNLTQELLVVRKRRRLSEYFTP